MDLKDFVSSALIQIIEGVNAAQASVTAGGSVVPAGGGDPRRRAWGEIFEQIEFDVAVVASSTSEVAGRAKAGIQVLGGGIEGSHIESSSSTSRIKFKVPVGFSQKRGGGQEAAAQ